MREVHLFAVRKRSAELATFQRAITGIGKVTDVRTAFRIDDALAGLKHAEATTEASRPADAILTWPMPNSDLHAGTVAALMQAAAILDSPRCSLLDGERHDIVPGSGSVLISFALHRLPTLDRKSFQSYWLNHHAEHGRRTLLPPNTYSQIHAVDPAASVVALAVATGISIDTHDGVAECYFPSIDAFKAQMARADVAVDALEDEKNFIDHSKSTFGLFAVSK